MENQNLERARRLIQSLEALPESKKEVLVAYSEGMAAMVSLPEKKGEKHDR